MDGTLLVEDSDTEHFSADKGSLNLDDLSIANDARSYSTDDDSLASNENVPHPPLSRIVDEDMVDQDLDDNLSIADSSTYANSVRRHDYYCPAVLETVRLEAKAYIETSPMYRKC